MKTKHTEGEWYVSDIPQEDGNYIYTKHNPFSAIARVYKGDNPHASKSEANAKLIAAAPELLQQLYIMTALCKIKYGNLDGDVWEQIQKSELTIKKATE